MAKTRAQEAAAASLGLDELIAEGADAFERGDLFAAHECFRRAQLQDSDDPRVLSWLGLTCTLHAKDEYRGVALSEEAIRRGGANPDALYRLARVYEAVKQRQRAIRAVRAGLAIDSTHPKLVSLIASYGIRRPPVLPFLARSNPINKVLGRIRHRILEARAARAEREDE